jgi:hypothetical protein
MSEVVLRIVHIFLVSFIPPVIHHHSFITDAAETWKLAVSLNTALNYCHWYVFFTQHRHGLLFLQNKEKHNKNCYPEICACLELHAA